MTANTTISQLNSTGESAIDVVMLSAERAAGVIEMALSFLSNNNKHYDQNLFHALCAAKREITDIRSVCEGYRDEKPVTATGILRADGSVINPDTVDVGLFAKLLKYAEVTVEQAFGIDAELKRYYANIEGQLATAGTDPQAKFVEVGYWADNHLLAAGNRYRLIDNATQEMLFEFEAESLSDAKTKVGHFLRFGIQGGAK